VNHALPRHGWPHRRRQQLRLVLQAIGMLVAAIGVVVGLWFYVAVLVVLTTPAPTPR